VVLLERFVIIKQFSIKHKEWLDIISLQFSWKVTANLQKTPEWLFRCFLMFFVL